MTNLNALQNQVVQFLQSKKICHGWKTTYSDNKPVLTEWLPIRVTKADRFFRANGVIVSRNWAAAIIRAGMGNIAKA